MPSWSSCGCARRTTHWRRDNVHWSIALAAKQLELGMVKRNARFALKQPRPTSSPNRSRPQETSKVPRDGQGDKVEKVARWNKVE